ncbi:hypothetical protein EON83_30480 [bacterium]|nr:MAG: hypothetical protein EON83_30480 [bacterium]
MHGLLVLGTCCSRCVPCCLTNSFVQSPATHTPPSTHAQTHVHSHTRTRTRSCTHGYIAWLAYTCACVRVRVLSPATWAHNARTHARTHRTLCIAAGSGPRTARPRGW